MPSEGPMTIPYEEHLRAALAVVDRLQARLDERQPADRLALAVLLGAASFAVDPVRIRFGLAAADAVTQLAARTLRQTMRPRR